MLENGFKLISTPQNQLVR